MGRLLGKVRLRLESLTECFGHMLVGVVGRWEKLVLLGSWVECSERTMVAAVEKSGMPLLGSWVGCSVHMQVAVVVKLGKLVLLGNLDECSARRLVEEVAVGTKRGVEVPCACLCMSAEVGVMGREELQRALGRRRGLRSRSPDQ